MMQLEEDNQMNKEVSKSVPKSKTAIFRSCDELHTGKRRKELSVSFIKVDERKGYTYLIIRVASKLTSKT
jgi:hypothetical protein